MKDTMQIDILMIVYNRPEYTQMALDRLLKSAQCGARIWVWQNGSDADTLDVVNSFLQTGRIFRYFHSSTNEKLNRPTNWFWENSQGDLIGKVDDDCLVPMGWIETLCTAHADNPHFGAIGCWHYMPCDTTFDALSGRVFDFNGHNLLGNCWIGGSGYLMKRIAQRRQGFLRNGQSWPNYTLRLAATGWINGWYYPFLYQEHMDDPRSPNTRIRTDDDVVRMGGLSAKGRGVSTIEAVLARQETGLREILTSSLNPRMHVGWRPKVRRIVDRTFQFGKSKR